MKLSGGYSYLNIALTSLIFVEAIFNQPYKFLLKKVNIFRFQFYQMITDIIAITWVLYYMGGIQAPVVSIAYYVVILWAGVVSGPAAVFFAVISSCLMLTLVVLLEYFGVLPHVAIDYVKIPFLHVFSLLMGNVVFLFAFGYFSAHSSGVIKSLERKRQEESLRYTHRFLAAGYLFNSLAHDMVNHLAGVKGYAGILLDKIKDGSLTDKEFDTATALKKIGELETENIKLVTQLSKFSRKQNEKRELIDLNNTIQDALVLTSALAKASNIRVETKLANELPFIIADKDQIQEVVITLILNSLDSIGKVGQISIETEHVKETNCLQLVISDTGSGIRQDYLNKITEPRLAEKNEMIGAGLGLDIVREIISRHKGLLEIKSSTGKGTTITILLPVTENE